MLDTFHTCRSSEMTYFRQKKVSLNTFTSCIAPGEFCQLSQISYFVTKRDWVVCYCHYGGSTFKSTPTPGLHLLSAADGKLRGQLAKLPSQDLLTADIYWVKIFVILAPQEEINSVCMYWFIDCISQPTVVSEGNLTLKDKLGADQST